MTLLRELPADFCFARSTYQSQVEVKEAVQDVAGDNTTVQNLTANEATVMALNEVAASHGRGFFWHFPSRDRLKNDRKTEGQSKEHKRTRRSKGERVPQDVTPDRMPDTIEFLLPTVTYTDFAWSDRGRRRFLETPHRARYLLCDGLLNPPRATTPLHCIQYAGHARYQVFSTGRPSLIVLQTGSAFYAMSTRDLNAMLGRMRRNSMQFSQVSSLWEAAGEREMEAFRCLDVRQLYLRVTTLCVPGTSSPMTAEAVSRYIPRPRAPPRRAQLVGAGSSEAGNNQSGPKSTKGLVKPRKKGKSSPERPGDGADAGGMAAMPLGWAVENELASQGTQ